MMPAAQWQLLIEMSAIRKMSLYRLLGMLLLVFTSGFSTWAQSQASDEKPLPVSLIRVIAYPEKLDGHTLRVIGFLDYGGGLDRSVCLYLSEADGEMPLCRTASTLTKLSTKLISTSTNM
jgi:hypothetical protein